MNERTFSLPGAKSAAAESPQAKEGKKKVERPESQPERTTEKRVSQETNEESGKNFEAIYKKLQLEAGMIQHERDITFAIGHLQAEGLQTLLSKFGADQVFEVMKKQSDEKGSGTVTILDVVQTLEPDRNKRKQIYEQMKLDSAGVAEKRGELEHDSVHPPEDYFSQMYGGGENFKRLSELKAQTLSNLDTVLGKIGSKTRRAFLDSRVGELSNLVLQSEEDGQNISKALSESGDIYTLAEKRSREIDARTEKLNVERLKLLAVLSLEVQRITEEKSVKMEEFRAKAVNDLSAVMKLEVVSKEMKTELEKAAQKVETEIIVRSEAIQKEIDSETAPLREMIEQLNRSTY